MHGLLAALLLMIAVRQHVREQQVRRPEPPRRRGRGRLDNMIVYGISEGQGICWRCRGWGTLKDGTACPRCGGAGKLTGRPCPYCRGSGEQWSMTKPRCPECDGSGVDRRDWEASRLAALPADSWERAMSADAGTGDREPPA
jgi:DnaJ-class molecular chaperone